MGVYDQAARYLVNRKPDGYFSWLSSRFTAAWNFRGWLDTSTIAFPGEPDRICDTVADWESVSDTGRRCILDVEFQSEPDGDMPERAGEYAFRLRRELRYGPGQAGKYGVISVLINLTGPPQTELLVMVVEELDAGIRLRMVLRTLREEDAAGTLRQVADGQLALCIFPWIPLMRGANESGFIEEWKRLAGQESDTQWRSDYAGLALVFAELANCRTAWQHALEGWNVKQSQQVLEWQEEARKETRIEERAKGLLRALQLRFRVEVPADLATAIANLTDLDQLSHWFDASQTAESLEAFRAAVQH